MSTRPIKADFYSNARAFTSHLSKRRNRNSPFQSNHMTLLLAMFLLPLLASFAKGQLPRSDQAVSCDGKIEDRERPAAPISMNTSKPDEMMLCDDSFENEAKERDGFAARQPRLLSSKTDEECIEETKNNDARFPQRGLKLKSCVLSIFLQEPLKHIRIDHSG